ncbi:MAG: hypothetical protein ABWK15_08480 [Dissulfuribacterales bacterium]
MNSAIDSQKQHAVAPPMADLYFLQNQVESLSGPAATFGQASPSTSTDIWSGIALMTKENRPVFTAPFQIDIRDPFMKKRTKRVCCILDTRNMVVATEEFPSQLTGDVLQLSIKERLQANGLWVQGQEMEMRLHSIQENGPNRLYNISLTASSDIQGIMDTLCLQGISLKGILSLAHSVSGLVSTLLNEPAMVLYCGPNLLQLMATGDKMVYSMQFFPYEAENTLPVFILNQAMEIVKMNVKRLYGLDIKNLVAVGPRYDICPSIINGIELVQPDWQRILTSPSNEEVTRFPGLYGAYFANSNFDFLPKEWRYAMTLQKFGMAATLAAGILAAGLGGYGAYLYKLNQDQTMEYQRLFNSISVRQAAIAANLPPETTKKELETWLELRSTAIERPRLDTMLAYMAEALEPEVSVVTLNISAQAQTSGQNPTPIPKTPPGQTDNTGQSVQALPTGPFHISIVMESKGTFEETRLRINRSLSNLCSNFQLDEPNWQYDETQQLCTVTCRMTPKTPKTIPGVQS